MMADLGSELPLPLSSDLRAGADLLVGGGGLRRLTQLLGDAGQQGLLAHEQGRLKFLPQQEVMFGLLHLREQGKKTSQSLTTDNSLVSIRGPAKMSLCCVQHHKSFIRQPDGVR